MKKSTGQVTTKTEVTIEYDEAEFSEEFMAQYRETFYSDFDRVAHHIDNIAKQAVLGNISYAGFLEGYGYLKIDGQYKWEHDLDKRMNVNVITSYAETEADLNEALPFNCAF